MTNLKGLCTRPKREGLLYCKGNKKVDISIQISPKQEWQYEGIDSTTMKHIYTSKDRSVTIYIDGDTKADIFD